jgi:hypothetical protein
MPFLQPKSLTVHTSRDTFPFTPTERHRIIHHYSIRRYVFQAEIATHPTSLHHVGIVGTMEVFAHVEADFTIRSAMFYILYARSEIDSKQSTFEVSVAWNIFFLVDVQPSACL